MYNLKQYNIHLPHSLQQTSTVTTMSQNMRTTITSYSISSTKLQKLTISVADFASTAVVLFTMVFFLFLTTIISIFNYKQLLQVESTDRAGHRYRQILHWSPTLPLAGVSGYAWALCSRCSWIANISTKNIQFISITTLPQFIFFHQSPFMLWMQFFLSLHDIFAAEQLVHLSFKILFAMQFFIFPSCYFL